MTQGRFEFDKTSAANFFTYHAANPHIYEALRRFALEAKRHGRRRLGMKAVFERLRWWSLVEARSDAFKLNNNYTAHYARLLMKNEAELRDFFETRVQRSTGSK